MKQKPKLWEWMFAAALLALSLFRDPVMAFADRLPPVLTCVLDIFSRTPGMGIGFCIAYGLRQAAYWTMSPQEQRDADRTGKDERDLIIRGKSAYLCLNITWFALLAFAFVLYSRGLPDEAYLLCWLIVCSILCYSLISLVYRKRM